MISTEYKIAAAHRTQDIEYAIRDISVLANEVARQGMTMRFLNIGDPMAFDFRTPPHIVEAIHRGMLEGDTGYAPTEGIPIAIDAIRRQEQQKGIDNICQICVTTGASEGIELALTALVNPGEKVLLPSPGYPLYPAVLAKIGGVPNPYYLDEENGWQPDTADIEAKIDDKTRAIVIINPNNPTGSLTCDDTLREIVEIAKRYNLVIFADEIYDKILFNGDKHTSIATLAGDHPCITFSGLAKSYLGPGLRLGWAVISGDRERVAGFTEGFMKMARARLCSSTPTQWAIPAALDGDQSHLVDMISRLEKRAELVTKGLNAIDGLCCAKPKGAFYVFPSIDFPGTDTEFVTRLARETGVVAVPGSGFGQRPGSKHLRLVFLPPESYLEQSLELIAKFVKCY